MAWPVGLVRKLAALRCQATQTAPVIDVMGVDAFRSWWRTETFRSPDGRDLSFAT